MRNNAWITLENSLAVAWWDWFQWYIADPDTRGPEPALSEFDKRALTKLVDLNFSFQAFKQATITALAPKDKWRMLSVYDIKVPEWIDAAYAQHGNAKSGGDFDVAGVWWWGPGDPQCALDPNYPWKPNQVIEFMPDECAHYDVQNNCDAWLPADTVTDVVLLYNQPPRELPQD